MDGKKCLRTYFIVNTVFLSSCGTWPYQHAILRKIFQYFWITQQTIIIVAKSIKLYEIKNDTDLMIEAVASFFYNIIMTIKFINQVVNENKVKIILEKIQHDWKSLLDDSEIKMLSYYARLGKFLNFMYIGAVYVTLISYMAVPLTPIILDLILPLNESRPKQPLIMAEFFIDQDKYFYYLMVHVYLSALYGIIPLLATDTLYMNCVHHACGMLKILGNRIRDILNSPSSGQSNKIKYDKMVKCIIQHQNIIEFCNNINETYSTSFLIVLFLSITLMSFSGVATVIKLGNNFNDVIRFGFFSVAQIFHLLCYNYMGQSVVNYGEDLTVQIYNTNWYEASLKTQRLIKFMMAKNMHPMTLRAYIIPLSLPNFTHVMKMSMSYFTVLQSTR